MSIDNCRARNWCFTLNNYTPEEYEEAKSITCSYIIIGKEVGANGTPHLQCYIEFTNAVRGSAIRKRFNERAHWEVRKGTSKQASEYCKKENNFIELGTLSAQGRRTDLETIGQAVVDGDSIKEIATTYPGTFIKYHKGINALRNALYEHRTEPPTVVWRWGLAGVGKSRGAYEAHSTFYIKDGTPWWDGYEQQVAIVIDDFDVGKWPFRDMLRLLDRYPYQGQYKGGYIPINSPFIYITCEHPPYHFWSGNELAQVMRRLAQVIEVKPPILGCYAQTPQNGAPVEETKTGLST
nr:putative replication associated protein [Crucivirus sp.]